MKPTEDESLKRRALLVLGASDMFMAKAAAQALLDDEGEDVWYRRALETAIAICYWRPFSKNKMGVLEPDDAPQKQDWQELHVWLHDRRDKAYAHTDMEAGRAAGISIQSVEEGVATAAWAEQWEVFPVERLPTIIEMCEAQAHRFLEMAARLDIEQSAS